MNIKICKYSIARTSYAATLYKDCA